MDRFVHSHTSRMIANSPIIAMPPTASPFNEFSPEADEQFPWQASPSHRPYITVVLAMSADGKIADAHRSAARFPSATDKAHLENQIAQADATLFGAGTLRAYGTTLSITNPDLIAQRQQRQQADQPIQIVCSATGNLKPDWPFFRQRIPRWLITTLEGMETWQAKAQSSPNPNSYSKNQTHPAFHHVLITERPFHWSSVLQDLHAGKSGLSTAASRPPIQHLLVMGGGELVASLLTEGFIDELHLTICPLLIGGKTAPSPVGGLGFTLPRTPKLELQSSRVEGDEVFLHYRVSRVTPLAPAISDQN
jgi:5-amino-6-(5-phosphoribosylamino)uracil reductase